MLFAEALRDGTLPVTVVEVIEDVLHVAEVRLQGLDLLQQLVDALRVARDLLQLGAQELVEPTKERHTRGNDKEMRFQLYIYIYMYKVAMNH